MVPPEQEIDQCKRNIFNMQWILPDRYPVFWEEVRRRVCGRGFRNLPVLKILLGLGVIIGLLPFLARDRSGLALFWQDILGVQGFLTMLFGPGLAVGAFTAERERGSLDFLFLTPLTTRSITLQKFASACAVLLLIVLFFLPLSLTTGLLGQVSAREFTVTYLLQLTRGLCCVAVGLTASGLASNTRTATALTFGVTFSIIAFSLFIELHQDLLLALAYLILTAIALLVCISSLERQRAPVMQGVKGPPRLQPVSSSSGPRWYLPDKHPVMWDDLRRRLRGGRAYTIMLGFGLALCAMLAIITVLTASEMSLEDWPELGRKLVLYAIIGQAIMMVVISPGLTATIFSSERETGRVDFLHMTCLTSRELVLGKYCGSLAVLLLTLICGAPVMAIIAVTFGGVAPWEFGLGYLVIMLCGLFCASTALLYSCKAKNSSAALVQGYLISFLGMLGAIALTFIFFFGIIWTIIEVIRNLNHAAKRLDDWRRHSGTEDPYTLPLMKGAEDNR